MNSFTEVIRNDYQKCISDSCSARRCTLLVGTIGEECLAIMDLDKYTRSYSNTDRKMCDFLIFHSEGDIAICVAELKGGGIKAKEARNQIQEGAQLAEQIISKHRTRKFYPILVRNRSKRLNSLDYKLLQNTLIKFQSVAFHIGIVPSGTSLENIFGNAS